MIYVILTVILKIKFQFKDFFQIISRTYLDQPQQYPFTGVWGGIIREHAAIQMQKEKQVDTCKTVSLRRFLSSQNITPYQP